MATSAHNAPNQQLLLAAASGNPEALLQALSHQANPNTLDAQNNTPLHLACMQSNTACTQALLQCEQTPLHHTNADGYTPLSCAIEYGEEENALAILRSGKIKTAPAGTLHRASYWGQAQVVEALCKLSGDNALTKDAQQHTPLYYAARYGHANCLRILLDTVPDYTLPLALLCTAIEHLHASCADLLLQRQLEEACPTLEQAILQEDTATLQTLQPAIATYRCIGGLPPLHLAAALNKTIALKQLLLIQQSHISRASQQGNTPLHYAAMQGSEESLRLLLTHPKINPNSLNDEHSTPLCLASWHGYSRCVQALLQHSHTDANIADEDGWTPLCWAAYWGHQTSLAHLLQRGKTLDINHANNKGQTALHLAATKGRTACLQLLLASPHINKRLQDARGNTALQCARQKGHTACVNLLRA